MSPEAILVSLGYLLGLYWPYLLGVLLIGVVAGWFSYIRRVS
jgi:hypothetical protein